MATKSISTTTKKVPVVVYRYKGSPFADKLDNVLSIKGVPHYQVEQPMTMPRPDLSNLLGVTYRRIPVIAIGKDVYVDTSLIIETLEKHFPKSSGYGTLFPPRRGGGFADTGLVKAFAMFYADRALFPLGAASLPYKKFPKEFIADRGAWQGAPMDVDKIIARQPIVKSQISSHASLLEEQLSDGRQWVLDTEEPGYGDISLFFVYSWILIFRSMKDAITPEKFPRLLSWVKRTAAYIGQKKEALASQCPVIKGEEAARLIAESEFVEDLIFDEDEASRLNVKLHDQVAVTPEDNAKNYPTVGKLVALSREQVVIETGGQIADHVRVHFPRLNFDIRNADQVRGPSKL